MKNFIQEGNILGLITPTGGVIAGQPVLIGSIFAVAKNDYAEGEEGDYVREGVLTLTKVTTDVVTQGAKLYWNSSEGKLTVTSSGNTFVGYATAAAGNTSTTVDILIGVAPKGDTGATGAAGAAGANGTNGTNGNTILNGSGDPSSGDGVNGDFWINTTAWTIFGPKTGGAWGTGTSLIGGE